MPTLDELKAAHPEWCFNCGGFNLPGSTAAAIHVCHLTEFVFLIKSAIIDLEAENSRLENRLANMRATLGRCLHCPTEDGSQALCDECQRLVRVVLSGA